MSSTVTTDRDTRPAPIEAVPVRHPGRWVAVAVIALLVAMAVNSVVTNPNWAWQFQFQNAFTEPVVHGVLTTLWLTAASMAMGVLLGIVLAVMRLSPNPVLSGSAWFYIWVFRGTPVLVQLVIWANLGSLYRQISLGVPFGPGWFTIDTRNLIPNAVAALLGLGLNEAAYMSEIIRAGILSVDEGQTEAASALGMTYRQSLYHVILPQGLRRMVPATVSQLITLNKDTTLVSIIAITEVMRRARIVTASNFFTVVEAPILHVFIFVGLLFVIVNFSLSRLSRRLELRERKLTGTRMKRVRGLEDQVTVDPV